MLYGYFKLKMDNIFSYPRKLKQSTIENENLISNANFRYKKLNILMGSNASGKTSLVRAIWSIMLLLKENDKRNLENIININTDESYIEIDRVVKIATKANLLRLKIKTENNPEDLKVEMACKKIPVGKKSSYESCKKRLDAFEYEYSDYESVLRDLDLRGIGWNVVIPATEALFNRVSFLEFKDEQESNDYLTMLNTVLKSLDPAIIEITRSKDTDNAYVVQHENVGAIIAQANNSLSSIPSLSSGTEYGFNITNIFFSVRHRRIGIYLIDGQFSYIDSTIEKAMIAKLANMIGDDEQIFITTHNHEVADMKLPLHSYYFLNKEKTEQGMKICVNCASEIEKRNNVAAKSIIDNDLFGISPDINPIFELGENRGMSL